MGCEMYLKFASGRGTETVIFIVMSLALISSVQIQCDVSVGVLARAWPTSRMPNGRSLLIIKSRSFPVWIQYFHSNWNVPGETFPPHRRKDRHISNNGHRSDESDGYLRPTFFQNMSVDVKVLFRLWWLSQDAWLKNRDVTWRTLPAIKRSQWSHLTPNWRW